MKKFLLGTSALVGVVMLTGQAMAAEAPTVALSGWIDVNIGAGAGDAVAAGSGAIDTDTELKVSASGTADNGLSYGAAIELEADQGSTGNADENYMWVSGSWGKVELGNNDGASDQLAVTSPTAASGLYSDGDWENYIGTLSELNDGGRKAPDSGDSAKVTYIGSFDAVSFGASYTPTSSASGSNSASDSATGNYQSVTELGVKYSGSANDTSFTVGATYDMGSYSVASSTGNDLAAWQVGATVSSAGWTLGASYVDAGDSGVATGTTQDAKGYALGVSYETGPWLIAADYASDETNSTTDADGFGIGATYTVAPGLYVAGEVVSYDDNNGGTKADGTVAILSTGVSF